MPVQPGSLSGSGETGSGAAVTRKIPPPRPAGALASGSPLPDFEPTGSTPVPDGALESASGALGMNSAQPASAQPGSVGGGSAGAQNEGSGSGGGVKPSGSNSSSSLAATGGGAGGGGPGASGNGSGNGGSSQTGIAVSPPAGMPSGSSNPELNPRDQGSSESNPTAGMGGSGVAATDPSGTTAGTQADLISSLASSARSSTTGAGSSASGNSSAGFSLPGASDSSSGGSAAGNGSGTPSNKEQGDEMSFPQFSRKEEREKAVKVGFEITVVCRKDSVLLHPGGYVITRRTLEAQRAGGDGLLVEQLRAIVRERQLADPLIQIKPSLKYVVESQGDELFWTSRKQAVFALSDWPSKLVIAGPQGRSPIQMGGR